MFVYASNCNVQLDNLNDNYLFHTSLGCQPYENRRVEDIQAVIRQK